MLKGNLHATKSIRYLLSIFVLLFGIFNSIHAQPLESSQPLAPAEHPSPVDGPVDAEALTQGIEALTKAARSKASLSTPTVDQGLPDEVVREILSGSVGKNSAQAMSEFGKRYVEFVALLNRKFANKQRFSTRRDFVREIERNRWQKSYANVGRFEAKVFNSRIVVRFVTGEDTDFPKSVLINPDAGIDANIGVPQFTIFPDAEQSSGINSPEHPIQNSQLDKYASRHAINRDLYGPTKIVKTFVYRIAHGQFADLFRNLIGEPYKSLFYIHISDQGISEKSFTPAVQSVFSKSYWRHRIKGTVEMPKYENYFLGTAAGGIELLSGISFVLTAHYFDPANFALDLISPVIWAAYSFTLTTNADLYNRNVELGNNRFWQATKRLTAAAIPSYLCLFLTGWVFKGLNLHDAVANLASVKSTFLIFAVGFGDRYLSTVMNVGPKIQSRFFLKPWWFKERVKTPWRNEAAEYFENPEIKDSTIKGAQLTREVLAKIRFPFKFAALFLDASLMQYTTVHINGVELPIPVASLMLWTLGIPFEVFNYFYLKRTVQDHPQVAEERDEFLRSSILRWFFPKEDPGVVEARLDQIRATTKEQASTPNSIPAESNRMVSKISSLISRCESRLRAIGDSFKDQYYPPF